MTKKIITISVDVDTWMQAKDSKVNISSYLNECLKSITGMPELDHKIIDIQAEIELIDQELSKLYLKKSVLSATIKQEEEKQALKNKAETQEERLENERMMAKVRGIISSGVLQK